jgi:hypothetical protein
MHFRSLRATVPALLAMTAVAQAQAPRHTSTEKYEAATITLEHGQPPWTEERLGAMQQIAPGIPWRMGSEGLTTMEIKGAPILFGDKVVQPARYGVNLARSGANEWSFVLFDPIHEQEQNGFMMRGDEKNQVVVPTKFAADAQPSVPALTIDVTGDKHCGKCELQWGPMRVSAPITPITISNATVSINSNETETTWYAYPLAPEADLSKPMIAGHIGLTIDDDDCTMNVYVSRQGDQIVADLRNVEREQWELENSKIAEQQKLLDAAIQQFGQQAEAQIAPMITALKRKNARNEVMLEETVGRPDNLKFTEKAYDGTGTGLKCELVKTRSGLKLEITLGNKTGVLAIDESKFTAKASG